MRPYRPDGSSIWYVPVYDWSARKWRYHSSRTDDLEAAKRLQKKLARESVDPAQARQDSATIEQALDLIILKKQEELAAIPPQGSPATIVFYQYKASAALATLERLEGKPSRIQHVATADVMDLYVSRRRLDGAHVGTIQKELATIGFALKLAKRKGWWSGDIDEIMPDLGTVYVPKTRVLSMSDVAAVLREMQPGYGAVLAFALATSADWGDFWRTSAEDVGTHYVHVRGTKNAARDRVVPIVTDWQRSLLEHSLRFSDGPGELLFKEATGYRWVLRRAANNLGLPHFSPKDLRRTCCTWLLAGGMPKEHVRKVMGHVDDRMIDKVYDQTTPEQLRAMMLGSSTGYPGTPVLVGRVGPDGHSQVTDLRGEKGWLTGLEPATPGVTVQFGRGFIDNSWPESRHLKKDGAEQATSQVPAAHLRLA